MTRIPQIQPDDMNEEQKRVYDDVMATTGRSTGPSIGYAYAPGLWESTNRVSDHLADCSLSQRQVRIAAITAARHWNAPFPFAVQVRQAFDVGVEPEIVDAINDGVRPEFAAPEDAAVYDVARELLAGGGLGDDGFAKAVEVLGYQRLVDTVGAVGHFCKVCMMANVVGAVPPETVPVKLKQ
jgi:4-carboxymuconolactone decarboxylase